MTVKEYAAALSAQIVRLKDMDPATITQDDIPDIIPRDIIERIETLSEIELLMSLLRRYVEIIRPMDTPQVTFQCIPWLSRYLLADRYLHLRKIGVVEDMGPDTYVQFFGV